MKDLIFRLAFLGLLLVVFPLVLCCIIAPDENGNELRIYDTDKKEIIKMDMEDYIVGVVCAEMPASFSKEALKAQSVAARTYAIRKIDSDISLHHGADLCTDFAHCQAYCSQKNAREKWKDDFDDNISKIREAVESTRGEYLEFNGETAITVFHSCSNGITEKSADVWGGDVPYLTNVQSEGDLKKKDYQNVYKFTESDFKMKISDFIQKNIDENQIMIGNIEYTDGQNVKSIEIYGNSISGTDMRKIFNLPSSSFEIKCENNTVIFETYGSGHGVGMSQYGANAMSDDGYTYREILSHYYPGTELKNLNK